MKINKLLILSALVMGGAFAACTDETDYKPAPAEANSQVYFANDTETSYDLVEGESSFQVPVYRKNTKGELTVALKSNDPSDMFNVPGSVTFADGASEAFINVGYDFNKLVPDEMYSLTILLQNSDVTTLYGNSAITVLAGYAPWSEWEEAGTCDFEYSLIFSGLDPDLKLFVRESAINPTKKQFKVENALYGVDFYINYDASTGICDVPEIYTGYTHSQGPVYVADTYTYFKDDIEDGYAAAIENQWPGMLLPSTYDEETGKFSLNLIYFIPDLGFFGYGYEYVQRAGFAYYNIDLADAGHWVNPDGEDFQIISAKKSEDVASFKVDVFSGLLSDEELDAAAQQVADDGSLEVYTEDQMLTYKLKEGDYTVVAVGYNSAREQVTVNYLQFHSAPASPNQDDSEDWESIGLADFEDGWILPAYDLDPSLYGWSVEMQQYKEDPNIVRLVNPYTCEESMLVDVNANSKKAAVVIDCTLPDCVVVEPQYSGFTEASELGQMYVYESDYFMMQYYNVEAQDISDAGLGTSIYQDGVIYMTEPMFTCDAVDFKLGYWWNMEPDPNADPLLYPVVIYRPDAPDMLRRYNARKHFDSHVALNLNMRHIKKANLKGTIAKPAFKKRAPHKYDNKKIVGKNLR